MNRSRFGNLFHFLIFFLRQTKTDWAVKANAAERYNAVRRSRENIGAQHRATSNHSCSWQVCTSFWLTKLFRIVVNELTFNSLFTSRSGLVHREVLESLCRRRFPSQSQTVWRSVIARRRSSLQAKIKCLFLVSPVAKSRIAIMDWFPQRFVYQFHHFHLFTSSCLLRC